MKIECGKRAAEKYARLRKWHDWFAWRPVKVGKFDCRWLEVVQRKSEWLGCYDGCYRFDEYRAKRNAS